jgi:hypothetical protein
MAHAFKIIPANPTFGTLRPNVFQSDYIVNKKAKLAYCNSSSKCVNNINSSYNQMNLFNNGRRISFNYLANNKLIPFNKTNLVAGLYSKMDLENVCTLINGFPCNHIDTCTACKNAVSINKDSLVPLNWTNTIDPVGELFGNTPCGTDNFIDYMKFTC